MILVAGLAVAGLVGIAAAFYFSIRSGHGGGKRLRSAGAGRARTDRRLGSRSAGPTMPGRTDHTRRISNADRSLNAGRTPNAASRKYRAEASTGPNPVPDFGDPVLAGTDRPRRRVGFRKGADLDEELWPAEAFGGISDEQFWDDMASDKPPTTARTAQQEPGPRKRPLDAAQVPDRQPVRAKPEERSRGEDRSRGGDRRGAGYGAYPESRTGPNPAAERTAVQPAYTATQPVRVQATQPVRVQASQPLTAETQPAETRGHRRRSSAEEDPLTSSAFALRESGPVDGRSALRSRESSSGGGSGEFRASEPRPGGGTSPYPYPGGSYGDTSAVTQAMNNPPYGENYGYGGSPTDRAGDPRRQNGTRNQARPAGAGEGTRPARVYPQDGHQATGSYQGNGNYPTGGYPAGGYPPGGYRGNGHQGNGHRAPYDPRDDYRRLTHQH